MKLFLPSITIKQLKQNTRQAIGESKIDKAVILLVEDEESLASFLITELELEGYEVIWAKDGREVLAIFKEKEITLILLDWMLPVYDGLTVLRQIRQSSNVPIIMITARSQTYDISMALDQRLDGGLQNEVSHPVGGK